MKRGLREGGNHPRHVLVRGVILNRFAANVLERELSGSTLSPLSFLKKQA
jgi:hypothetical protein